MIRLAPLCLGALLLCGCVSSFYDARTAGPLLEQASRLPAASLRAHMGCQFGFAAAGTRKADITAGACAFSDTTLYLYSWDPFQKRYRREVQLEMASLPGFSRAKFGTWSQLQVPVDGGSVVFEARSVDLFQQALQKAGVKELPTAGYVNTNVPPQPTTIYIPVYVGG